MHRIPSFLNLHADIILPLSPMIPQHLRCMLGGYKYTDFYSLWQRQVKKDNHVTPCDPRL